MNQLPFLPFFLSHFWKIQVLISLNKEKTTATFEEYLYCDLDTKEL